MHVNIRTWTLERYRIIVNSIAFFPAFIALVFLLVSWLLIQFDFSEQGKHVKASLKWLSLADASTARSIISAIAAGIISLTVFSFSMVMIVLNQAAAQMSNRVLDKLIGNRFQQIVLGIYIGTIVYALFLLSTIRDIDSGVHIPAISIYLLILLTIFDIFLFIYFLHYITQSIKYEVIIERIYSQTCESMELICDLEKKPVDIEQPGFQFTIFTDKAGVYEGYEKLALLKICNQHNCVLHMLHPPGSFLLKGVPVIKISKELSDDDNTRILAAVIMPTGESINRNYLYGFRQLMEVAIKALSPGVNDPGTAIVSLRALFQLLNYRCCHFPKNMIHLKNEQPAIMINNLPFERIFDVYLLPIWAYGRNDRLIQFEMRDLLEQFQQISPNSAAGKLLIEVKEQINLH